MWLRYKDAFYLHNEIHHIFVIHEFIIGEYFIVQNSCSDAYINHIYSTLILALLIWEDRESFEFMLVFDIVFR